MLLEILKSWGRDYAEFYRAKIDAAKLNRAIKMADLLFKGDGKKRYVIKGFDDKWYPLTSNELFRLKQRGIFRKDANIVHILKMAAYVTPDKITAGLRGKIYK